MAIKKDQAFTSEVVACLLAVLKKRQRQLGGLDLLEGALSYANSLVQVYTWLTIIVIWSWHCSLLIFRALNFHDSEHLQKYFDNEVFLICGVAI